MALIGISILSFVVFIDFTIVNTILPGIQRELNASFDQLQQATATMTATSALPAASAGLAIGVLYSIWNFGSSIGLALGGLIFEEADRRSLTAALARENLTLSAKDQDLMRSLLSDPSQAQALLGKLTPGLEAKILPLFRDAFMAGYGGAMWYLLITCAIGAILVPLIARGAKRGG